MPQGAAETSTLKVGDQAPDFTVKAHGDRMVTLSDYRGKNVFICFYLVLKKEVSPNSASSC